MNKNVLIVEQTDSTGYKIQQLYDIDSEKCIFSVSDLSECPEDAIIDRDLFNANDAIRLLELGIKYSNQNYDSIKTTYLECPYNEDIEEFAIEQINKIKRV